MADLGRTVFVETEGVLLRRRIFSFRPGPHLFLAVRLNGAERFHDRHAEREGVYRAAMEGIRAARLSGFLICAKTTVFEDTDPQDFEALGKMIGTLGLDGWVVTRAPGASRSDAMEKMMEAAREMSGRRCAAFSKLVEAAEEMANVRLPVIAGVSFGEEPHEEAIEQEVRVP
jgi:hypothetical protein